MSTTAPDAGDGLMQRVLPGFVEVAESFGDPTDARGLYPEEEAAVEAAVAKRRHEFAAVRRNARKALGRLGVEPGPIVPGPNRDPQWPAGIVGSMTHCAGYQAAAIAPALKLAGIGIDAEPHQALPAGVAAVVATPKDLAELRALRALRLGIAWDRLLLSAKEAVFKAWFPVTMRWLDFADCDIEFSPEGTFEATLGVAGPVVAGVRLQRFNGRWTTTSSTGSGLLATAVVIPANGDEAPSKFPDP